MGGTVMIVCGVAVAKLGKYMDEQAKVNSVKMTIVPKRGVEFFIE